MTTPTINYPDSFDNDDNLYLVHDSLRVRLTADYNPGDATISVEGDLSNWPTRGILTLTEQCSDIDDRAISFFYDGIDATTNVISGLELLPKFPDVIKLKRVTNVTQNVMALHHNSLKDALVAIQTFIGVKGTIDTQPFGPTLEGRINFLRKVALQPKAWFAANVQTGIVPLEVEFNNLSFRLATDGSTGPIVVTWDFGDQTTSVVSAVSAVSTASGLEADGSIVVLDAVGGTIKKTYYHPGYFDVKLTVQNQFGSDTCVFEKFINARIPAPKEAIIRLVAGEGQTTTAGSPPDGPYTVVPTIRSPINTLIQIEVPEGETTGSPGYSYAGEPLDGSGSPLDPVTNYTWHLSDDLNHPNSRSTKASYGVGGIYDLKLRVDTEFGAYRITTYHNAIDVVENANLWMWLSQDGVNVRSYEYGLLSESFKLNSASSYPIVRNSSFLDNVPNSTEQKRAFMKNTGFAPRGTVYSGKGGSTLLYWASGRSESDPASSETVNFVEYNGFADTYISRNTISRPWNWASFSSPSKAFFSFGLQAITPLPDTSPTNATMTAVDLVSFTPTDTTLDVTSFSNGAQELLNNVAVYNSDGTPTFGYYSVYKTAWKDNTGYIARNDGVGPFFRIKSFYRTEGTLGNPFSTVRKLPDILGTTKLEGELTNLSQGIYFINNSGSISAYQEASGEWRTGGPGVNSVVYRAFQDTSVEGFDDQANTLLIASDGVFDAYISFDYSENVFLNFNEINTTFRTLGSRPSGEQFLMGVY